MPFNSPKILSGKILIPPYYHSKRYFLWKFRDESKVLNNDSKENGKYKSPRKIRDNQWMKVPLLNKKNKLRKDRLSESDGAYLDPSNTKEIPFFAKLKGKECSKTYNPQRDKIDRLYGAYKDAFARTEAGYAEYFSFLSPDGTHISREVSSEENVYQESPKKEFVGMNVEKKSIKATYRQCSHIINKNFTEKSTLPTQSEGKLSRTEVLQKSNFSKELMFHCVPASMSVGPKELRSCFRYDFQSSKQKEHGGHDISHRMTNFNEIILLNTVSSRNQRFYNIHHRLFESYLHKPTFPGATYSFLRFSAIRHHLHNEQSPHKRISIASEHDENCQWSCTRGKPVMEAITSSAFTSNMCILRANSAAFKTSERDSLNKGDDVTYAEKNNNMDMSTVANTDIVKNEDHFTNQDHDSQKLLEFFKQRIVLSLFSFRLQEDQSTSKISDQKISMNGQILDSDDHRQIPSNFLLPLSRWIVHDVLLHENVATHCIISQGSRDKKNFYQLMKLNFADQTTLSVAHYEPAFRILLSAFQLYAKLSPSTETMMCHTKIKGRKFINSLFTHQTVEDLTICIVRELREKLLQENFHSQSRGPKPIFTAHKNEYGESCLMNNTTHDQYDHGCMIKKRPDFLRNDSWANSIRAFASLERFFGVFGYPQVSTAMYNTKALSELIVLLTKAFLKLSSCSEKPQIHSDEAMLEILFDRSDEEVPKRNASHENFIIEIIVNLYERSKRFGSLLSRNATLCALFFLGRTNRSMVWPLYKVCVSCVNVHSLLYTKLTSFVLRRGLCTWQFGLSMVSSLTYSYDEGNGNSSNVKKQCSKNYYEWEGITASCVTWEQCAQVVSASLKEPYPINSWRLYLQAFKFAGKSCLNRTFDGIQTDTLPESVCMQLIWKITRYCRETPRLARLSIASLMMRRGLWEHAFVITQSPQSLADAHNILQKIRQSTKKTPLWLEALSMQSENTLQRAKRYEFEDILRDLAQKSADQVRPVRSVDTKNSALWFVAINLIEKWNTVPKKWPLSRPSYHLSPYASALLFCVPGVPKSILDSVVHPESLLGDSQLDTQLTSRMSSTNVEKIILKFAHEQGNIDFLLTKTLVMGSLWVAAVKVWLQTPHVRAHGHILNALFDKRMYRDALSQIFQSALQEKRHAFTACTDLFQSFSENIVSKAAPLSSKFAHYYVRSALVSFRKPFDGEDGADPNTLAKRFIWRQNFADTMRSILAHTPKGSMLFRNYFVKLVDTCNWDFYDFFTTYLRQKSLRGVSHSYGKGDHGASNFISAEERFVHTMLANLHIPQFSSENFNLSHWLQQQQVNMTDLNKQVSMTLSSSEQTDEYDYHEDEDGDTLEKQAHGNVVKAQVLLEDPAQKAKAPFMPSWEVVLSHFSSFANVSNSNQREDSKNPVLIDNFSRERINTSAVPKAYSQGWYHMPHGPAYYMLILRCIMMARYPCTYHPKVDAYITPLWWWWYMVRISGPQAQLTSEYYHLLMHTLWYATRGEAQLIVWSFRKTFRSHFAMNPAEKENVRFLQFLQTLVLNRSVLHRMYQGECSMWKSAALSVHRQKSSSNDPVSSRAKSIHTKYYVPSIMALNLAVATLLDCDLQVSPLRINSTEKGDLRKRDLMRAKPRGSKVFDLWLRIPTLSQTMNSQPCRIPSAKWKTAISSLIYWAYEKGWQWEHEISGIDSEVSSGSESTCQTHLSTGNEFRCPFNSTYSSIFQCYDSFPLTTAWERRSKGNSSSNEIHQNRTFVKVHHPSATREAIQCRLFGYELPAILSNFICQYADAQTLCRLLFGVIRADIASLDSSVRDQDALLADRLRAEFAFVAQAIGHVRFKLTLAPRLRQPSILRVTKYLFSLDESSLERFIGTQSKNSENRHPRDTLQGAMSSKRDPEAHKKIVYPLMMYIPHEGLRIHATAEYFLQNMNYKEWVSIVFRNFRTHPALFTRLVLYLVEKYERKTLFGDITLPSSFIHAIYTEYERSKSEPKASVSGGNSYLSNDFISNSMIDSQPEIVSALLWIFSILVRSDVLFTDAVAPSLQLLQREGFGKLSVQLLANSINRTFYRSETWISSMLEEEHKILRRSKNSGELPSLSNLEGATMRPLSDFREIIVKTLRKAPLQKIDWQLSLLCVCGLHPLDMVRATKRCWKTSLHVLTTLSRHISSESTEGSCYSSLNFLYADREKLNEGRDNQKISNALSHNTLTRCFLCVLAVLYKANQKASFKATVLFMAQEGMFDSLGIVRRFARKISLSGQKLFSLVRGLCANNKNQWCDATAVCLKNYKECHMATMLHPLENIKTPWYISLMLMSLVLAQGVKRHFVVRSHYVDRLQKCLENHVDEKSRRLIDLKISPTWVMDVLPYQHVLRHYETYSNGPGLCDESPCFEGTPPQSIISWYNAIEAYASYKSNNAPYNETFVRTMVRCLRQPRPDAVVRLYYACRKEIQSKEVLRLTLESAVDQFRWIDCLRMALNHGESLGQFIGEPLRSRAIDIVLASCNDAPLFRLLLSSKQSCSTHISVKTALDVDGMTAENWERVIKRCSQFGRWQHLLELVNTSTAPHDVRQGILRPDGILHRIFVRSIAETSPKHLQHFVSTPEDFFAGAKVFFHKYELLLRSVSNFYNCSNHDRQDMAANIFSLMYALRHPANRAAFQHILDLSHNLSVVAKKIPEITVATKLWIEVLNFIQWKIPHELLMTFCWNPLRDKTKDMTVMKNLMDNIDDEAPESSTGLKSLFFSEVLSVKNVSLWAPLQKCIRWSSSYSSTVVALNEVFSILHSPYSRPFSDESLPNAQGVSSGSISEAGFARFLTRSLFSELLQRVSIKYCSQSLDAAREVLKSVLSLWLTSRKSSLETKDPAQVSTSSTSNIQDFIDQKRDSVKSLEQFDIHRFLSAGEYSFSLNRSRILQNFLNTQRVSIAMKDLNVDQDIQDEIYAACTLILRRMTSAKDVLTSSDISQVNKTDFEQMIFPAKEDKSNEMPSIPVFGRQNSAAWKVALSFLCSTPECVDDLNKSKKLTYYHRPIDGIQCRYRFLHDFFGRFCYTVARYSPFSWSAALSLASFTRISCVESPTQSHVAFGLNSFALNSTKGYIFPVSWVNPTNITGILNILRRNVLWKECLSIFSAFHATSFTSTPFATPPFRNQLKVRSRIDDILRTSRATLRALFDSGAWEASILLLQKYIQPISQDSLVREQIRSSNEILQEVDVFPLKLMLTIYRYVAKICSLQSAWEAAVRVFSKGIQAYEFFLNINDHNSDKKSRSISFIDSVKCAFEKENLHTEATRIFGTIFCDIIDCWRTKKRDSWLQSLLLLYHFNSIALTRTRSMDSHCAEELFRVSSYVNASLFDLSIPWSVGLRAVSPLLQTFRSKNCQITSVSRQKNISFVLNKALLHHLQSSLIVGPPPQVSKRWCAEKLHAHLRRREKLKSTNGPITAEMPPAEYLVSNITISNPKTHLYMARFYFCPRNGVLSSAKSELYMFHFARFYSFFDQKQGKDLH